MNTVTSSALVVNSDSTRYGLRAPIGGCTVGGKVYKGGQFAPPFDPANPHGIEAKAGPVKVAIYGHTYSVEAIDAGECGRVAFQMTKLSANVTYSVLQDNHGEVTCSCPDFEWKRQGTGQPCKHGRKLIELGMISTVRPVEAPVPTPSATSDIDFDGWLSDRARESDAARHASDDESACGVFQGPPMSWVPITPYVSIQVNQTPTRTEYPRRRPFVPTPQENREAAALLAELACC